MVLYIGSGTDVGLQVGFRGLGLYNARYYEEYIIDLGDLHLATVDDGAMFFHDTEDFSVYAGASGNTPFKTIFTDSGGLTAEAWCGEVGGGLDHGSDVPFVPTVVGTEWTENSQNNWSFSGAGGRSEILMANVLAAGELWEISLTLSDLSSNSVMVYFGSNTPSATISANGTCLIKATYFNRNYVMFASDWANSFNLIINHIKQVTDIPATGLKLYSTKNGTTQSMGTTDAGFNPDAITKVDIYG